LVRGGDNSLLGDRRKRTFCWTRRHSQELCLRGGGGQRRLVYGLLANQQMKRHCRGGWGAPFFWCATTGGGGGGEQLRRKVNAGFGCRGMGTLRVEGFHLGGWWGLVEERRSRLKGRVLPIIREVLKERLEGWVECIGEGSVLVKAIPKEGTVCQPGRIGAWVDQIRISWARGTKSAAHKEMGKVGEKKKITSSTRLYLRELPSITHWVLEKLKVTGSKKKEAWWGWGGRISRMGSMSWLCSLENSGQEGKVIFAESKRRPVHEQRGGRRGKRKGTGGENLHQTLNRQSVQNAKGSETKKKKKSQFTQRAE